MVLPIPSSHTCDANTASNSALQPSTIATSSPLTNLKAVANSTAPRPALTEGSWPSIRDELSAFDISFMWNEGGADSERAGFRPCYEENFGEGASTVMPASAVYIGKPSHNAIYLPTSIDPTLVQYFENNGLIQDYHLVANVDEIAQKARTTGRKVYAIDDYGVKNDDITVNSTQTMKIVNSKEYVNALSSYACPETCVTFDQATDRDYLQYAKPGKRVYLKTCNTESTGRGVFPVTSLEEYRSTIATLKAKAQSMNLSNLLVIQPELTGENKSFQVFMGNNQLGLVADATQLIADDGKTFAGNINHTVNQESVARLSTIVEDFVDKTQSLCPDAFGFAVCDYFQDESGTKTVIDPGLRPTGNTAAAMISAWLKEEGIHAYVHNLVPFAMKKPMNFENVAALLGNLVDKNHIATHARGVLPWGFNHADGSGVLIFVAPTEADYPALLKEVNAKLNGAIDESVLQ